MAMLSLSYPPPTDRMMCAGMMLMMPAAAAPTLQELAHSEANKPTNTVADTPNQAGT